MTACTSYGSSLAPEVAASEPVLAEAVPNGVDHDVAGVGDAVDPRDLVAVVGRDRHLDDAFAGTEQLQDDLGVEVEVVAVADERELGERRHPVGAVPRVPLAQTRAGDRVLCGGEDPVADVLVERHAARAAHRRGSIIREPNTASASPSTIGDNRSAIFSGAY